MTSTGNQGLDAIAERVYQRIAKMWGRDNNRMLDVRAAAEYIGRTPETELLTDIKLDGQDHPRPEQGSQDFNAPKRGCSLIRQV